MLILTESFYLRPTVMSGAGVLEGMDYYQLHVRRLRFAREALFGPQHRLPGWYSREALGTPFSANLHSFPWIPTRLALLALDPTIAYAAGIAIAAGLAALFAFLFARRAGMSRVGSFTAAGTFAGAGFFASRVMAGHLPLLEAYPALPLLLWLVDRAARRRDLMALAAASACVTAAGHPQLPFYALASALAYALWKYRGAVRARVAGAMICGAGLTLVVWWPMLLLIGRSTRVLRLATANNDIAMPYGRLLALIAPGIHGWPYPVALADMHPFSGYPNAAYFWDTASYAGILPLVATAAMAIGCAKRRRMPRGRWMFLAVLGTAAFAFALPVMSPVLHLLPGTLLRSSARLLYIPTFCAAVATGVFVDRLRRAHWPVTLVFVVVGAHFASLWWFAQHFVQVYPRDEDAPAFQATIDREAGDARIAEERNVDNVYSNNDRHDDAGGFDSIFLTQYYRELHALAGAPAGTNRQNVDASELPKNTLEAIGVRFVITSQRRSDLELDARDQDANLYRVANAVPRAALTSGWIRYERPSSDEILLHTNGFAAGFARVLETYDPGWSATMDGMPAPVTPANALAMAIPVPAGAHRVQLRYKTPGRTTGAALSVMSLAGLVLLLAPARERT